MSAGDPKNFKYFSHSRASASQVSGCANSEEVLRQPDELILDSRFWSAILAREERGKRMGRERFLISAALVLDREEGCARLDGRPLRLGAKAIAVLDALMSEPGRLLPKERLFDLAWPDQAVSDSVLTTAIKEVRQALNDNARQPEWIATEHGRGYRYLQDVTPSAVDPGLRALPASPAPGEAPAKVTALQWPLVLAALGVLVIIAGLMVGSLVSSDREAGASQDSVQTKSVIVLPFETFDDEIAHILARGLNEEILTTLTRTPDIQVAGASIVRRVLESGADGDNAGKAAGFGHILHGVVRISDDRIRVTVRLTQTQSGLEIWSNRFDHSTDDVIALQEDIAVQIVRALDSVMDPDRLRAMAQIGTRSVEAYQAYRAGKDLVADAVTTSNPDLMRKARESYARAVAADPEFARAHWEFAYMELMTANTIYSDPASQAWGDDARERYIDHVEAAIRAAPNDTDRLLYRAAREVADLRYRESVRLLERYLAERPRDMDIWYNLLEQARIAQRDDLVDTAIRQLLKLGRQRGFYPVIGSNYMDHDAELALQYAEDGMKAMPDYTALQFQAHRAFLIASRPEEARKLLTRIQTGRLPVSVRLGAEIRQLCAEGQTDQAQDLARELLDNESVPIVAKWSSALTAGLTDEAYELLIPLERSENLLPLSQFLIYSEFDAGRFPELVAAMARADIDRGSPIRPIYSCRID